MNSRMKEGKATFMNYVESLAPDIFNETGKLYL